MKDTCCVLPIPAYEQGSGLMYPTMYNHQLVGATVTLNFTLTHWFIPVRLGQTQYASDIYSAELLSMHVVHLPLPTIISPHKRKVSTIDPLSEGGSPSKQSKQTMSFDFQFTFYIVISSNFSDLISSFKPVIHFESENFSYLLLHSLLIMSTFLDYLTIPS